MTEEEEWEGVRAALRAAGVDSTDLARFVNRPHPGVISPEHFDAQAALPILLDWLPRAHARPVVETLARRIAQGGPSSESARALIAKYRERPDWAVGDAIARVMTPAEHDEVVELCADRDAGTERQMLVYALWRVKTDRARELVRELLQDPAVARQARHAARLGGG